MQKSFLKIGELARRTGVSVRTLHHYDAIGLLAPAHGGRGEARLYGPEELTRLTRVRALQELGLSLEEIHRCLDEPGFDPLAAVESQLVQLEERLRLGEALRQRLGSIASSLRATEAPSVEDLMQALELMNEMEKLNQYYSAEQLKALEERRQAVGGDRIQAVQAEWSRLFEELGRQHAAGAEPTSPAVLALARKARALIAEFSGGDAGIEGSLGKLHTENPDVHRGWGVSDELWQFLGTAQAALAESEGE